MVYIISVSYNVYLYYKKGTTLGYELLGMRIVSEETGEKKTE
jgi:uncharacterized RDD family membrane protein YckC